MGFDVGSSILGLGVLGVAALGVTWALRSCGVDSAQLSPPERDKRITGLGRVRASDIDVLLEGFDGPLAVGFAADAAGRFRCSLGVAAVTYGAGAFNLVNSVAGAFAEKSPVVVISGAPGSAEGRSGLLLHHQGRTLDTQFRVYQEVTCAQTRPSAEFNESLAWACRPTSSLANPKRSRAVALK